MPRAPDQRVEEARKLYASGAKLIEVSQKLGIPVGTIRSWKNRYKYEDGRYSVIRISEFLRNVRSLPQTWRKWHGNKNETGN